MKILHISTYSRKGGASIGCSRLHEALLLNNINSKVLVLDPVIHDQYIYSTTNSWFKAKLNLLKLIWEKFIFQFYQKSASVRFQFSLANAGEDISNHPLIKEASIIQLHWINHSFISLKGLEKIFSLGKPVVWTFHDMWAFTGGCHHSYECEGYLKQCGFCPYIKNGSSSDISNSIWNKKKSIFSKVDFTYVCVGSWLYKRAKDSSLLLNKSGLVIPNTINVNSFRPLNKTESREKFNLPLRGKILLFGSVRLDDPIKGWSYLTEAIKIVIKLNPMLVKELSIVLFGSRIKNVSLLNDIPIESFFIKNVKDDSSLSALYSAADATVVSSLYETFSLVACESMACGTPVVAFDHTGPKDIIDHKKSGYLAQYKSAEDLANGILWCLDDNDKNATQKHCREKVLTKFNYPVISESYIRLYRSLLK